MTLEKNRHLAIAFAIATMVLRTGRTLCFGGHVDSALQLPIAADAYVVGALLIGSAWKAERNMAARALMTASWGFACGIMYRSTFEQLADPSRHSSPQLLVLGVKAILFTFAIAGFLGAVSRDAYGAGRTSNPAI